MITQFRLMELLVYDADSGIFTRRGDRGGYAAGSVAGTRTPDGYVRISVDGREYEAGRLAWLYMTGSWPSVLIDHRDMDGFNNRWVNIREASASLNGANRGIPKHNKSGLKGVSWSKCTQKWLSRICVNRRAIHLGVFDCKAAAHFAYVIAADNYFGKFARVVGPSPRSCNASHGK